MKKYILHILFLVLSCAAFFFVYYSASNGILLFEDNSEEAYADRLRLALAGARADAKAILLDLRELAENDAVRLALAQPEDEEAQDRGLLALKRFADTWPSCFSLRLLDTEDRVCIDARAEANAGKKLSEDEQAVLRDLLRKPESFEFLPDARVSAAVRVRSGAQQDMGALSAVFEVSFLTAHFQDDTLKARVSDGLVIIAKEEARYGGDAKLQELASMLQESSKTMRFEGRVFVQAETGFSSSRAALGGDDDLRELPVLAVQLLILSGLIFLALLLLLILRMLHYGDAERTASVERALGANDALSQDTQATIENIAEAQAKLEKRPEYTVLDESEAITVEEMPTLQSVLARSRIEERPQDRERDEELERVIHTVTDKSDVYEEADLVPDEVGAAGESGAFAEYWQTVLPALERAFGTCDVLLLVDDGSGKFRVQCVHGLAYGGHDTCVIARSEKLFQAFPEKRKILYIKEAALDTQTIKSRFPELPAGAIDQLAIIPVTKEGEVLALLLIAKESGAPAFDQTALQEIQCLSVL